MTSTAPATISEHGSATVRALGVDQLDDLREMLDARLLVERTRADQTLAAVNDFSPSYSSEDRELARVVLERGAAHVALLERALDRMDDGSYGSCLSCSRPIAFEWLAIIPEAGHCIGCMRIG